MLKPIICFLIDDDKDDQEIFAMALENLGLPVKFLVASNGPEALDWLSQKDGPVPDYIFLDLNMPVMSGKECLAELKKIHRLNRIPIIIFTTSSMEKDLTDTKALGAEGFIVKPSRISELANSLCGLFVRA